MNQQTSDGYLFLWIKYLSIILLKNKKSLSSYLNATDKEDRTKDGIVLRKDWHWASCLCNSIVGISVVSQEIK